MSQTESSNAAPQSTPAARRWPAALSLACVALFAALMHWPIFVQGKTVSAFDLSYFSMGAYRGARPAGLERPSNGLLSDPVVMYQVWDRIRYDGRVGFPWLWNPYAGAGSPLLANGESTPLFPVKVLAYAFAGPIWGFGLLCFLKMLLAGLLVLAYLRRVRASWLAGVFGAVAFMGSGFMVAWLQWAHTNVAIWAPLMLIGCEDLVEGKRRRGLVIVAVANALGLLGGHPETSLHVSVAAVIYLVARLLFGPRQPSGAATRAPWWRPAPVGVFCGALAAGGLIAAVQIVPMVEYIALSARLKARAHEAGAGAYPSVLSAPDLRRSRAELIGLLLPNTYGNPARHSHWWREGTNYNESAGYVGLGALFLSALSWRYVRRDRRILCLGILQLISLGFVLHVPLIVATVGRLPLLSIAANRRFLLVWCLASAAMGALSLDQVLRAKRVSRTDVVWVGAIAVCFVALAAYDFAKRFAPNPEAWIRGYGRAQMVHFGCFLIPALAACLLPPRLSGVRRWVAAGLVAALGADVFLVHFGYNPFVPGSEIYPRVAAIGFLQSQTAPVRVLPIDTHLGPNMLGVYGIEDVRLYDAQVYEPYDRFLARLGCFGSWRIVRDPDMRLCSIAGVRYLLAGPDWADQAPEGTATVYRDETSAVVENHDALPLAFVSRGWRVVGSPDEAYAALAGEEFPWRRAVTIEASEDTVRPPASGDETPEHVAATIVEHRAQEVRIELPEGGPGLLVLSDTFYPGWKARVDGRRRPIHRVNGAFRGVFVEPGDRRVVFTFEPASFRYGLLLSLAGLVVLGAVAIAPRLRAVTPRLRGSLSAA